MTDNQLDPGEAGRVYPLAESGMAFIYELLLKRPGNGRFIEHLNALLPGSRLVVLVGSESDLPSVEDLPDKLPEIGLFVILSAHRNWDMLFAFACLLPENTVVLTAGGLSFALPGMLRAMLNSLGKTNQIFGVALGDTPEKRRIAFEAMTVLPGGLADSIVVKGEDQSWEEFIWFVREALSRQDEISKWRFKGVQTEPEKPPKVIGLAHALKTGD